MAVVRDGAARRNIAILRDAIGARPMADAILAQGHAPVFVPPMVFATLAEGQTALRAALRGASNYDALCVGSKHVATLLAELLSEVGQPWDGPVAVVGAKTEAALDRRWLAGPVWRGAEARAEGLVSCLRARLTPPARVLFPRARGGRTHLMEALAPTDIEVHAIEVYELRARALSDSEWTALRGADAIVFLSAEGLRCLLDGGGATARAVLASCPCVFALGPVGADKARGWGVRVDEVAPRPDLEVAGRTVAEVVSRLAGAGRI